VVSVCCCGVPVPFGAEVNPLPSFQLISMVLPFSAVYSMVGVVSLVLLSVEFVPVSLVVIRSMVLSGGLVVSRVMKSVWVVWLPAGSVVCTWIILRPSVG